MKAPSSIQKIERRNYWTWQVYGLKDSPVEMLEKLVASAGSRRLTSPFKTTAGRRTIWVLETDLPNKQDIFVKHYSRPSLLKQFKHIFRNSRTRQEWEMGVRLGETGFPVAKPLAMAERKSFGLLQEDYLFQESLEGYENFDAWFDRKFESQKSDVDDAEARPAKSSKERRRVISELAALVRRMHDKGVMQRDFKPDSIMVGPAGDFKLVDLERVLIKKRGLSLSDRLKNLAKLDQAFSHVGTTTDRLRFLKAYFRDDRLPLKKLYEYSGTVSHLSEIEFRKQARDRRAWIKSSNETYSVWNHRGFRIYSSRRSIPSFLQYIVRGAREGGGFAEKDYYVDSGIAYSSRWCRALTAFALSPQLRYRRVPHTIPEAALLPPGSDDWGLLVVPVSREPYCPVNESRYRLPKGEPALEFYRQLGRVLRILHRMGITWQRYPPDFMLCNPRAGGLVDKFLVNRLELLVTDQTPSAGQAVSILEEISHLLCLNHEQKKALHEGYRNCMMRHFSRFTCLRLPRSHERPEL
ncbi:MAG: lipopolysaccharide kinase InaA family protein [bacterium]